MSSRAISSFEWRLPPKSPSPSTGGARCHPAHSPGADGEVIVGYGKELLAENKRAPRAVRSSSGGTMSATGLVDRRLERAPSRSAAVLLSLDAYRASSFLLLRRGDPFGPRAVREAPSVAADRPDRGARGVFPPRLSFVTRPALRDSDDCVSPRARIPGERRLRCESSSDCSDSNSDSTCNKFIHEPLKVRPSPSRSTATG